MMTTTIQKTIIPPLLIQDLVSRCIDDIYGLTWKPRVVRQNKKIHVGTLETIDYAVPCFEIARQVNESPLLTAEKLAQAVNKTDIHLLNFRVEAVSGYMNFELTNECLKSAIFSAVDRIKQNHKTSPSSVATELIVVGPQVLSRAPRQDITALAYRYLDQVYEFLGLTMSAQFLLSDYSHETVEYLSSNKRPVIKRALAGGQIVHNYEFLDHEVSGQALSQLRNRQHQYQVPRSKDSWAKYEVITESIVAPLVHDYLDNLSSDQSLDIIKDAANKAIYMTEDGEALPLRSSNGLLYRVAFVLYLIDAAIKGYTRETALVLVVPQSLHLFIYAQVAKKFTDEGNARIVCFDPYVSKADILEIKRSMNSFAGHVKRMTKVLESIGRADEFSVEARADILSLVDFPQAINEFASLQQFPAVFDAINHSLQVTDKFRV